MDIKESLDNAMSKDIDRGQFLRYAGMGVLSIFGITRLLKHISESNQKTAPAKQRGFGSKINLKNRS